MFQREKVEVQLPELFHKIGAQAHFVRLHEFHSNVWLVTGRVSSPYAHSLPSSGVGAMTWSPLACGIISGKYDGRVPPYSRASLKVDKPRCLVFPVVLPLWSPLCQRPSSSVEACLFLVSFRCTPHVCVCVCSVPCWWRVPCTCSPARLFAGWFQLVTHKANIFQMLEPAATRLPYTPLMESAGFILMIHNRPETCDVMRCDATMCLCSVVACCVSVSVVLLGHKVELHFDVVHAV